MAWKRSITVKIFATLFIACNQHTFGQKKMSAIRFCVHALGLYLLFCGSFLAAQEGELHRYLVEQLDEVDWSKLEPRDQIQNYLGVSKP